jgi:hypothetical protein
LHEEFGFDNALRDKTISIVLKEPHLVFIPRGVPHVKPDLHHATVNGTKATTAVRQRIHHSEPQVQN